MEEYDDLLKKPSGETGILDLSYKGWVTLDEVVWDWGDVLIVLNLAHNNIETLPPRLGRLTLLRELDVSFNKLTAIPSEIGKCFRIKKLRASANHISKVPREIGKCAVLEELYLSENQLSQIPGEVGNLKCLKILKLQNNRLLEIPAELSLITTLTDLDCSGNTTLTAIPETLRGNTPMLLWYCSQALEHQRRLIEVAQHMTRMEAVVREQDADRAKLKEMISTLQAEREQLVHDRPVYYMYIKKQITSAVCSIS